MFHKIHISYPVLTFSYASEMLGNLNAPPKAFLDVRCFSVEPKAESAELKEPTSIIVSNITKHNNSSSAFASQLSSNSCHTTSPLAISSKATDVLLHVVTFGWSVPELLGTSFSLGHA